MDGTMTPAALEVLEGLSFAGGGVNTDDATIREHIRSSIRRGHPQVKPQPAQTDRVILVCGGPSLEDTFEELRQLYFEGAKVVALNNAAAWCLARNIRPSAQIVLDARASNARFVGTPIPQCRYLLASQCHPDVFDAVEGRDVWIWHAIGPEPETEAMLTAYYQGKFMAIGHGPIGGTTVLVRAIALLRTLGFFRFDVFGADSCVGDRGHHAYAQPENDADVVRAFRVQATGGQAHRIFRCTAWHLKQLEDFIRMIRATGHEYVLNLHGDGLLAYALSVTAELTVSDLNDTKE
jgi:hypothetical protein